MHKCGIEPKCLKNCKDFFKKVDKRKKFKISGFLYLVEYEILYVLQNLQNWFEYFSMSLILFCKRYDLAKNLYVLVGWAGGDFILL